MYVCVHVCVGACVFAIIKILLVGESELEAHLVVMGCYC